MDLNFFLFSVSAHAVMILPKRVTEMLVEMLSSSVHHKHPHVSFYTAFRGYIV